MKHNANVLCKQQPQRVQINASFVIDLRYVTFEDLEADDNGSYINNGSPTHTFECEFNAEKLTRCKRIASKKIEGSHYYYLVRKYRKCASATDLTRTISYCLTPSGEILNQVAFVQYNFKGGEHKFKLLTHGNAKSKHSAPYQRTKESTKAYLKSNLKDCTPKEAFHKTNRELGGAMGAGSAGQTPRNRKQVYNMKQSKPVGSLSLGDQSADVLGSLLSMANEEKQGDPNNVFLRSIQTHPNPLFLVLATATQLQNLETYCTSQYLSSVMTIDPTFNIGKFSVTPVTYQDLLLVSKRTGEHPICIGPMLISQNLTYDVFSDFIYCMQKNCPSLKQGLRSFGTDGEKALEKALVEGFPNSVKLRCMSHFRNNVKEHLKDVSVENRSKIVNQIFGQNDGDGIYKEGLLDADSPELFQSLYESVRDDWSAISHSFVSWFDSKIPTMKESMIASVRKAAGLGSPPAKFYTHGSESNNHVIKHKERYREVSLPQFVKDMKELRKDYDDDFVKAITGRGEYRLKYSHLEISTDQWFSMTVKQRESYVRKIRGLSMLEVLQGDSSPLQSLEVRTTPQLPTSGLSISWKKVKSPLDEAVLESIWTKAAKLCASPGAIQSAPYSEENTPATPVYLVVSSSSSREFYSVECGSTMSKVATCSCTGMKSSGICSHALAVCEKVGLLSQFLQYYSARKQSLNLTKINLGGNKDRHSVGRKPNQPRKRFKGQMPQNEVVVGCQKVFADNRPSMGNEAANVTPEVNYAVSQVQVQSFGCKAASSDEPGHGTNFPDGSSLPFSFNEQGNQFSFLEFLYDTNELQPGAHYLENSNMQSQNSSQVMQAQTPQSCYNQVRAPKPPLPQSDLHYVVGTIWGNVKKCFGCKHEFLPAPAPDNQFVLVRPESDWYFDKQSKSWRLGRKSNRYYHMFLQCVQKNNPHFSATQLVVPPNTPAAVKAVLFQRFGMYL